MEIYKLGDSKYKVVDNGNISIMTLDEVMVLLSTPSGRKFDGYEENEEFWRNSNEL